MKLYATTTSERASKGQGGNKYLDIQLTDNTGDNFLSVKVSQINTISEYDGDLLEYRVVIKNRNIELVNRSHWIKIKGKSQKGEKCASGHLQDLDGRCKCSNKDAY